jgi:hypothetical protein
MAKRAVKASKADSSKTGKGKQKVEWKGYVNLSLSEEQKAGFGVWAADTDIWENAVPTLIERGYVLSVAYDDYNQSVVAGLYCVNVADENAGWKLTARGEYPDVALARLIYIHLVLLEGNWSDSFHPEVDAW